MLKKPDTKKLKQSTLQQLNTLSNEIEADRIGVKILLIGPSGTGSSLAAKWLATRLGLPLYRVDLASVTSKYIGETEKNLNKLFDRAEEAGQILLFDEADSLFGKRSDVKDAHDRYANQQASYLLQRLEQYKGVAILASNSQSKLDDALSKKMDHVVKVESSTDNLRLKKS